ncbi:unnamed protein product [Ceutorhynchus assimilis]|uniref:DUF8207 domain-containing protein n=1 Tax=Ceutorhynchus assimilis TaxID=467358 RepID=A0A9N9QG55_9CUCU|nr:unnamed protein product [Ceutorhynchus assimilis]
MASVPSENDRNIKKKILNAARSIRKKYLALKLERKEEDEALDRIINPITEPLREFVEKMVGRKVQVKHEKVKLEAPKTYFESEPKLPRNVEFQPAEIIAQTSKNLKSDDDDDDDDDDGAEDVFYEPLQHLKEDLQKSIHDRSGAYEEFLDQYPKVAQEYVDRYYKQSDEIDHSYGLKHDMKTDDWSMGSQKVNFLPNGDIKVGGESYKGTQGLYDLLFLKKPIYQTKDDKLQFTDILNRTNVHRRDFDPSKQVLMENDSRARTILNLALRSEKVEGSRKRARKNLLSLIKDAESNPAEHLGVSTDRSELLTLQQDGMDSVEEKNEEIDTGCLSNDSMMISCQEEPSSECEVQFSITEMFPEVSPRKAEVTNSNIVVTQSNADDITINTAQEDFPAYDISPAVSAIEGLNQIDTAETPIYHEMEPYNITNDGQSPKESLALNDDSNVSEIGILEEGAGKENLILPSTSAGNKRPKRRVKQKSVAYLDYLSDDEVLFTDNDSDVWEEELSSSSEDEVNQNFKGKQKKNINKEKKNNNDAEEEDKNIVGELGKITKKPNKRALKKKAKQSGQEYVKSDGTVVPAKQIKPNPCSGKKCGNNCENISDERRKLIFDHFWNLSVDRRKDWIVAMSQKSMVKRKRSTESEKRQFTFKYFINEGEGKRSICLQFLCNTLDVSQKFIYYTVSNASFGSAQEDLRGKSIPPNKTKEGPILQVMNFIKSLPAVPSHYSRKDSNRLYLPQELKNLSHLYQVYKKNHIEQGIDVVGERVFRNIFNKNFNIGFHVPKKDKCLQCIRFERTDKADENMQKAKQDHETEKNHSYNQSF